MTRREARENLHGKVSTFKTSLRRRCSTSYAVEDDSPELDLNRNFQKFKDLVRTNQTCRQGRVMTFITEKLKMHRNAEGKSNGRLPEAP